MISALFTVLSGLKNLWGVGQSAWRFARGGSVVQVSLTAGALITAGLLLFDHLTAPPQTPRAPRVSSVRPMIRMLNQEKDLERKLDAVLSLLASQKEPASRDRQLREFTTSAETWLGNLRAQRAAIEVASDARFAAAKKEADERYLRLEAKLDSVRMRLRDGECPAPESFAALPARQPEHSVTPPSEERPAPQKLASSPILVVTPGQPAAPEPPTELTSTVR